jgi:putative glutamine amidotransferase
LRATAWSPDGLVEGVEDVRDDRWALGVQWHPEIDWQDDEFSTRLFNNFVNAAREYASTRTTYANAQS